MQGGREDIKKAIDDISKVVGIKEKEELKQAASTILGKGKSAKDAFGINDQMIEGIYSQAYQLYNSGKYQDASRLFRLLIVLNSNEPKFSMGLAACFHMMKEYRNAADVYTVVGMADPQNPIPQYHASDCFIQLGDKISAVIALEMAIKRSGNRPEFVQLKDRATLTLHSLKEELSKPKDF